MLDEFIMGQLQKLELEREQLNEQLQRLVIAENQEDSHIRDLLEHEDMGIELFSPRKANKTVKQQVADIKNHIEELQLQEARIQDELEKNNEMSEKYQQMLLEARDRSSYRSERKIVSDGYEKDADTDADTVDHISDSIDPIEENAQKSEESRPKNTNSQDPDMIRTQYLNDLMRIQDRIGVCLDYIHTDKVRCKNELKNMNYLLKALINRYSQNDS